MKAMKVGDKAFFYARAVVKLTRQIVGVEMRVVRSGTTRTTLDASGRFGMVDVEAVENLSRRPSHLPISRRHPNSQISHSCVTSPLIRGRL